MRSATIGVGLRQFANADADADSDAATLRKLWVEVKGTAPPKTFTARLMRLAFAWGVQAERECCEPAGTIRGWNRIVRDHLNRRYWVGKGNAGLHRVCGGTRIQKEWGGGTHEALVTGGGATWNGQSYSSFSAVPRAMAGTNRNGPKFFGLRDGSKS